MAHNRSWILNNYAWTCCWLVLEALLYARFGFSVENSLLEYFLCFIGTFTLRQRKICSNYDSRWFVLLFQMNHYEIVIFRIFIRGWFLTLKQTELLK